jgi:predicted RNase H-like nuclease (RuvC/YqgF family)
VVSAVLLEALKEQQNVMEELEAENDRLKAAMDHMKADFETRISKLEKLIQAFAEK